MVKTTGKSKLSYQVLHEYTLFHTEARELYAVVCIFGEEFAINFGDRSSADTPRG